MLPLTLMVSIILSLASAVQSVVGFGLAMLAVPLLLWSGIDLLSAVFLVLSISFTGALLGVSRLRSNFQLKQSLFASFLRILGILPGYALALKSQSSPTNLKAAIGLTIGLGVLAQSQKLRLFGKKGPAKPSSDRTPSRRAAPWAFFSSGILMGWLGMGGPPLIFWLLSGRQCPKTSRSFLYGVYVFTIPFQLLLMTLHQPKTAQVCLPLLAWAIPSSLLASAIALRVGDKLDVDRLQKLSLGLLALLALKALLEWAWSL